MQPDAEVFCADEAGVKQITQGDIDQHHHKKRGKNGGGDRAERLVQDGKRALSHTLRADSSSSGWKRSPSGFWFFVR